MSARQLMFDLSIGILLGAIGLYMLMHSNIHY